MMKDRLPVLFFLLINWSGRISRPAAAVQYLDVGGLVLVLYSQSPQYITVRGSHYSTTLDCYVLPASCGLEERPWAPWRNPHQC